MKMNIFGRVETGMEHPASKDFQWGRGRGEHWWTDSIIGLSTVACHLRTVVNAIWRWCTFLYYISHMHAVIGQFSGAYSSVRLGCPQPLYLRTWKKKRANGGLGEASELSLFPSPSPLSLPFSAGIQSLAAILFARLTIEQKYEKILGCEQSNRGVPGVIDDDFVFYSRSPARGGSIMPMIFVFRGMFLNTSTMMSSALPHTNWAFVTPAKQHMTLEWITQI